MPREIESLSSEERAALDIKIVFLDLDGTIIPSSGVISAATRDAIRKLRDRGIKVSVASGRPFFAATEIVKQLGIDGVSLFFAGALLYDPLSQKTMREAPLPAGELGDLIALGQDLGLSTELYEPESFSVEEITAYNKIHIDHYLHTNPKIEAFERVLQRDRVFKLQFIVPSQKSEELLLNIRALSPSFIIATSLGASHPEILFVNITSRDAERGVCFDWLLSYYGFNSDQVAAFGDADADLPFITRAGAGCVMGNAAETVRAKAKFVTRSVEHDGFVWACHAMGILD